MLTIVASVDHLILLQSRGGSAQLSPRGKIDLDYKYSKELRYTISGTRKLPDSVSVALSTSTVTPRRDQVCMPYATDKALGSVLDCAPSCAPARGAVSHSMYVLHSWGGYALWSVVYCRVQTARNHRDSVSYCLASMACSF